MRSLQWTLLAEGSSDRALEPILRWLLSQYFPPTHLEFVSFDPHHLDAPRARLSDRITRVLSVAAPCELLFVHRDADRAGRSARVAEIRAAARAAGNPHGTAPLSLPSSARLENIADPKELLNRLFDEAGDPSRRRRRGIHRGEQAASLAALIGDFSPLRALPAFQALESEIAHWAKRRWIPEEP